MDSKIEYIQEFHLLDLLSVKNYHYCEMLEIFMVYVNIKSKYFFAILLPLFECFNDNRLFFCCKYCNFVLFQTSFLSNMQSVVFCCYIFV